MLLVSGWRPVQCLQALEDGQGPLGSSAAARWPAGAGGVGKGSVGLITRGPCTGVMMCSWPRAWSCVERRARRRLLAIRRAIYAHDFGAMHQPVGERDDAGRTGEDFAQVGRSSVRGDDGALVQVEPTDQFEEHFGVAIGVGDSRPRQS